MSQITIGVDNGSSGTVGVITPSYSVFLPVPTKSCLHYGKAGTVSQRLDWGAFWNIFNALPLTTSTPRILLERPFTGSPMMIK